jgi:hypothetical protein
LDGDRRMIAIATPGPRVGSSFSGANSRTSGATRRAPESASRHISWWEPLAIAALVAYLVAIIVFPTAFPTTSTVGAIAVDVAARGRAVAELESGRGRRLRFRVTLR